MEKVAIFLFVIVMILGISYGMHAHTLSLFSKNEIGATYAELGSIGIVKFLPYVVIPIFIGILLDRINNGYLLMVGIGMHAIPLYMISTANTVEEIIAYHFVIGAAHAFIWPPTESILSSNPRKRAKYISRFIMFFMIGITIGPLLGMTILELTDENYRLLFQLAAGVMSVGIVSALVVRARAPRVRHGALDLKSFGKILRFPVVVAIVLFSTVIFGMLLTIFPAFLNDRGLDASIVLLLYFIYGIIRVGTMATVIRLHKWTTPTLVICTMLITVGMVLAIFGTNFFDFVVVMLLFGVGISIIYPIGLEVILARTERRIASKMIGAYGSVIGAGWVLGPILGGFLTFGFGAVAPYWLFGIWGVAMCGMAVALHNKLDVVAYTSDEWDDYE